MITGTVNVAKYKEAPHLLQPQEKEFLERFKKAGELRFFNVLVPNNPQINPNPGEEYTFTLRSVGEQDEASSASASRAAGPCWRSGRKKI